MLYKEYINKYLFIKNLNKKLFNGLSEKIKYLYQIKLIYLSFLFISIFLNINFDILFSISGNFFINNTLLFFQILFFLLFLVYLKMLSNDINCYKKDKIIEIINKIKEIEDSSSGIYNIYNTYNKKYTYIIFNEKEYEMYFKLNNKKCFDFEKYNENTTEFYNIVSEYLELSFSINSKKNIREKEKEKEENNIINKIIKYKKNIYVKFDSFFNQDNKDNKLNKNSKYFKIKKI